jgi:hypothetical protein
MKQAYWQRKNNKLQQEISNQTRKSPQPISKQSTSWTTLKKGRASENMVSWTYLTDSVNKRDEIGSTALVL